MSESEMDAQTDTKSEDTEKKSSTRRPAKKRSIKKVTKKPVKKTRATKTDGNDKNKKTSSRPSKKSATKKSTKRTSKPEGGDGGRTVISRRPPKKRVVQDASSQSGEALQEEPKKDMIVQSELHTEGARDSNVGEAPLAEKRSEELPEGSAGIQWGRRAKKSGPVGWDEKLPVSKGTRVPPSESLGSKPIDLPKPSEPVAQVSQASAPKVESKPIDSPKPSAPVAQVLQAPVPQETPNVSDKPGAPSPPRPTEVAAESAPSPVQAESAEAEARKDQTEQDNRRGRGRGGRNNNRGRRGRGRNEDSRNRNDNSERTRNEDSRNRSDDSLGRNEDQRGQERDTQPVEDLSASLMDLLAVSWTEEKTREYLNDGVLARLSPGLLEGNGESIKDIGALKEPLKAIRRVLADECMVADDVADIMLLDVVMGALADRIEVCLLQAKPQSLQDMNVLLDMRCKADKRLMEAVVALKNA